MSIALQMRELLISAGTIANRYCAVSLLVLLLSPAATSAQITGVVRADGIPLHGVAVEIWGDDRALAARVTDGTGAFAFTTVPPGAVALLARAIGYSPRRIVLASVRGPITIGLERLPQMLAPITAERSPPICPNREDGNARAEWSRAAARYRPFLQDALGLVTQTTGQLGIVMQGELSSLDSSRFWKGARWQNGSSLAGIRDRVMRSGFATERLPGSYAGDELGVWYYPALDSDLAGIFSDSAFAAQHTLSFLSAPDSEETTIVFCPRDRRRPALSGTLVVDPEHGFIRATWVFANPHRQAELAGGDVAFVPPSPTNQADRMPLLAASGSFWRKLPSGSYYRRWHAYERWELFAGSEPPKSRIP